MIQKRNNQFYTYPISTKLKIYLPALILLIVIMVGFLSLTIDMRSSSETVVSSSLPPPWGSLFLILVSILFLSVFSNVYPDIQLSQEGISIKVFLFWWVYVPWSLIVKVQPPIIGGARVRLVIVKKLTPIHIIFGLLFGLTFKPAFPISRDINDFSEVITFITESIS